MKKIKVLVTLITLILILNIEMSAIALASSGTVNAETVRVREEPSTNSDIVELVSIGDEIEIIGESGNWYQVKVGNVTGYIRKDLLTVSEDSENNNTGTLNNSGSNENDEPANGSEDGEENTETNSSQETNNEKYDITISTINFGTEGVSVGTKKQLESEIKLKILPSANSRNIAKIPANTEVTILEVINKWCRVEAGEYTGWVRIDQ